MPRLTTWMMLQTPIRHLESLSCSPGSGHGPGARPARARRRCSLSESDAASPRPGFRQPWTELTICDSDLLHLRVSFGPSLV